MARSIMTDRVALSWRERQIRDALVANLVAVGMIEKPMLWTLSFKQGLADLVVDAMRDAAFVARPSS